MKMRAIDLRVMGAIHLLGGVGYGLDIMHVANLGSGRVYPVLDRLQGMGWVEALWDDGPSEGYPKRMLYRLVPRLAPFVR